jgi:elongator complex protein 3
MSIWEKWKKFGQHIGFGKKLLIEAERLALQHEWVSKMAVIAWVGVQQYYEKRWYELEGTYMTKKIS